MTPEKLRQRLEEAFGDLEPPNFEELGAFYPVEREFKDAVKTDTASAKRWQELRTLGQYLGSSADIHLLTPKACQYYLPAYLYAMTDPEGIWRYLGSVLTALWYENEYGDFLFNDPTHRDRWERLAALLTDRQKRCIAHWLVEVLRTLNDPSVELDAEVDWEDARIEHMLERYWNAWL
jgi:hypothetical protein